MHSPHFFEKNSAQVQHFDWSRNSAERLLGLNDGLLPAIQCIAAVLILASMFPVLVLCALSVSVTSRGSWLYRQKRVGKGGVVFTIYKFRTMHDAAEATSGPVLSAADDQRVTAVGRFLRNTHLDELPQIFNILQGSMNFFGPRPERPEFVNEYQTSIPDYHLRHSIKPGVTGLAQICLPYDASAEEKISYDLFYLNHRFSLRMHNFVLWMTFKKVFSVRFNQSFKTVSIS